MLIKYVFANLWNVFYLFKKTEYLSFSNSQETKKIEILKPKNFKIFHLNYLIKEKSDNYDLMIYDMKENTLTL